MVLCVSILFKFEISCLCESFFKFNANLVMFTTINIYETILNKYYVHHIFKICIFTGMTSKAFNEELPDLFAVITAAQAVCHQ